MMAFFRRRRQMLCTLIGGTLVFTFLLLSTSNITSEEQERWRDIQPSEKAASASITPRKELHNNSNNAGEVVVQLWPKNTLELIHKAYQREQQAREKASVGVRVQPTQARALEPPLPISEKVVPCSPQNTECRRFRELIHNWPEGKPKAAFYFLTQSRRLFQLHKALNSVDTFFNDEFHYPIIIFHEAELIPHIPKIRTYSKSQLFFQEIEFTAPDFIGEIPEKIPCQSPISYRHMCRFHAKGVFQQPIIRGLDYYWRLDDDSVLLRKVPYNVFQFMHDKKLLYGYSWRHLDNMQCTAGLWKATYKYVNETGIKTEFLSEWQEPWLYYNNFEISEMNLWLSKGYADYVEYIDQLGGIFFHRWGDAPIKGLAVALFVPKDKVHKFKDIGYQHASYINH